MANDIKYCLVHGKEVSIRFLSGKECHPEYTELDGAYCCGPFAEVPPPSPLTDEDWDFILEGEHCYAS